MPPLISGKSLLDDLKRVARTLGRTPLTTEYERIGKYSTITVRKNFGSWREALEQAGLKPGQANRRLWSDSEVEKELARLTQFLGHAPSYTEIKRYGRISPDTFARRLGRSHFVDPRQPPLSHDWKLENVSVQDGAWISGLATGEGSFSVNNTGSVSFRIGLRADDVGILEFIREVMDFPQAIVKFSNAKRRAHGEKVGDEARLSISNRWVIRLRVIPFFDRFPLRGRKAMDFEIFKEAVNMLCLRDENGHFRQHFSEQEKTRLNELTNALKSLRVDPSVHAVE